MNLAPLYSGITIVTTGDPATAPPSGVSAEVDVMRAASHICAYPAKPPVR